MASSYYTGQYKVSGKWSGSGIRPTWIWGLMFLVGLGDPELLLLSRDGGGSKNKWVLSVPPERHLYSIVVKTAGWLQKDDLKPT